MTQKNVRVCRDRSKGWRCRRRGLVGRIGSGEVREEEVSRKDREWREGIGGG